MHCVFGCIVYLDITFSLDLAEILPCFASPPSLLFMTGGELGMVPDKLGFEDHVLNVFFFQMVETSRA